MKIGVLAVHSLELRGLRQRVALLSKEKFELSIVRANQPHFLNFDQDFHLVINVGFAGALSPNLTWSQVVLADRLVDRKTANRIDLDSSFLTRAENFLKAANCSFIKGTVLTTDKAILNDRKRESLFRETGCQAVDMESYYWAEKAKGKQVKFLCLKIISDFADGNAEQLVKEKGKVLSDKLGQVVFDLVQFLGL